MSIWSYATITVKIDRALIKTSIRDMILSFETENSTKMEIFNDVDGKQCLKSYLSDSIEADLFIRGIAKLVDGIRNTKGVLHVDCEVNGRL